MSGIEIHNLPTNDQDHFRIQSNIPNGHDQTSTPINIVIEDHFRIQNNIPNGHDQTSTPINIATDGQNQMWGWLPSMRFAIFGTPLVAMIILHTISMVVSFLAKYGFVENGTLQWIVLINDAIVVILVSVASINIATNVCSATLGMVSMAVSSLAKYGFVENTTLQCIVFIIVTAIIVTFIFRKHNINTPINIATDGQDQMWGWLPIVWKILEVCSATFGLAFLAVSSFSEKQFVGNKTLQCIVYIIVTAILVTFIFVRRNINVFLRNLHFFMEVVIRCVFLLVVGGLTFLIKYPRFNIHLALIKNCNMPYGIQYNLFAVGAFSFLALLVSSESEEPVELGFFSLLLGLTINASIEIPGKGTKLWYMSGAIMFCMLLIILRQYMDSLVRSTRNNCVANLMSERGRRRLIKILKFFSAASGLFFLSICPFFKNQFGNDIEVLLFIIIFTLLVYHFISREPSFSTYIRSQCRKYRLMKAIMNSLFLMMTTGIMFLDKYPRFQIHLEHKESNCDDSEDIKGIKLPHGSHFNLYSVASFSFMALIISCEKVPQLVDTGIFYFLLELTMDASIEILEEKIRNLWYILGAAIYCVVLIFLRTFFGPSGNSR